jgi:hypothetical protein
VRRGDAKRAAELWGAIGALTEWRGILSEIFVVTDTFLSATRSELGEATFVLHAATGARLTLDEAVALALEGATRE